MKKNFGAKAWTYPQPVFIIATYDEEGNPNAMNAAWGGISEETRITMCLDAEHKTVDNLLKRKAFTVSMADAAHVTACDYVGIVSGNKVKNKVKKAGFHVVKSEFVDAPVIEELPMVVECELISYDKESCTVIGEIINVAIDESVLTEKNKVDLTKFQPIVFDPVNMTYVKLGETVGKAFHDGVQLK